MQVSQEKFPINSHRQGHLLLRSFIPSATHKWEGEWGTGRETWSGRGWEENTHLGEEGLMGGQWVATNSQHFLFLFSLAASATGEEELAQPYDSGSFCPSWDYGAQDSPPVRVLGFEFQHTVHPAAPVRPSGRQVTLVRLLDGVFEDL